MPAHKIKRLDISFIWTRTFFNLLNSGTASAHPYAFLGRVSTYKPRYTALRSGLEDSDGLSLPWTRSNPNWFWKHYFQETQPRNLKGNKAWTLLVPLRKDVNERISATGLEKRARAAAYGVFYAHGVSTVLTVRLINSVSLEEAVKDALQVRFAASYEVKSGDGKRNSYSLTSLAKNLLDSFASEALGPEAGGGLEFSEDPFSIVTVIQGAEEYRDLLVEQNSDIHKALERLATWNEGWPSTDPPQIDDRKLEIKNVQDNHYLYAAKQGRAVWFPKLFTPPSDEASKKYALGWYHRNLVTASTQVASLGAFLKHTADRVDAGEAFPDAHRDWARNAIQALSRLSSGQNTYRTWSTRAQIERLGFQDATDRLKKEL